MDVMMPVMDGLEAMMEIMASCPTPILILSASVEPGHSRSAFNAIKHGALDVMEKPQGVVTEAFEEIAAPTDRKGQIPGPGPGHAPFPQAPPPLPPRPARDHRRRRILAVGASTGGPKAVMRLMKDLPPDSGARVLIVQHIARGFAEGFAEWLDRESSFTVRLAREGDRWKKASPWWLPTGPLGGPGGPGSSQRHLPGQLLPTLRRRPLQFPGPQ